ADDKLEKPTEKPRNKAPESVCVSMATGVCMLLVVGISVCAAFNLDTSFPLLKMGERGSLFGFSVALHQDLKTESYL
uniref:Uncharacterized protein n=1 Tax=Neolamprologus brichardi TaxID=32507 RepID=A0A3Q4HUJ9_NEOBR